MVPPTPRQRSRGGGFPLIALGVVLALATGLLVLLTDSGGAGPVTLASGTLVVVAAEPLRTGTVLSPSNGGAPYARVADAFHEERLPASALPPGAYPFTSEADLEKTLNQLIVVNDFLAGDVLRTNDPRLKPLGSGPANSIISHNPSALPPGDVPYAVQIGGTNAQEGDHIDILASLCVTTNKGNCQVVQTTLQNLLVYAVPSGSYFYVAVSHQDALALKFLVENAKLDVVIRQPGDTGAADTQSVDYTWIIAHFGFTQP